MNFQETEETPRLFNKNPRVIYVLSGKVKLEPFDDAKPFVDKHEFDSATEKLTLIENKEGMALRLLELFEDRRVADRKCARLEEELKIANEHAETLTIGLNGSRHKVQELNEEFSFVRAILENNSLSASVALQKIRDIFLPT